LTLKFTKKKNVTYAKQETVEQKKARIDALIDEQVIEFSIDWIILVFGSYGRDFVVGHLMNKGWHVHPGRYFRRAKYEGKLNVEEFRDINHLLKSHSIPIKKRMDVPKVPKCSDILEQVAQHLGPESQDPVSRVSSAFVTIGQPLEFVNTVLSKQPPQVEHKIYTKSGSFSRARSDCNGKLARKILFDGLLEELVDLEADTSEVRKIQLEREQKKREVIKEKEKEKEKEVVKQEDLDELKEKILENLRDTEIEIVKPKKRLAINFSTTLDRLKDDEVKTEKAKEFDDDHGPGAGYTQEHSGNRPDDE